MASLGNITENPTRRCSSCQDYLRNNTKVDEHHAQRCIVFAMLV